MGPRTSDLGRSLLARLAIAALFAFWARSLLANPHIPVVLQIELSLIAMLALARPLYGLLAVAALVPFSQIAVLMWHAPNVRWSDAIVGAFVLPWLAGVGSPLARRVRVDGWLSAAALLFGATVVASCAVALIRLEGGHLQAALVSAWVYFTQDFALIQTRTGGLPEGAALIEGLLLFWSVVTLGQAHADLPRRLIQTLVAAAVGAALFSVLVSAGFGPSQMLTQARLLSMWRVSGHVLDVNAAGSYFAMTACLALGMTVAARGRARAAWLAASIVIVYGLWLSGSRIALAAALVTFCLPVAQLRTPRVSPALVRRAVGLAMLFALSAYFVLRASPLSLGRPLGLRFQFVETAVRMFRSRPLFGVGIGDFYLQSRRFMPPELGWRYAFENAHNYFLQIAAELGVVGLALFIWLIVAVWRAIWNEQSRRNPVVIGAAAGLTAFLITCLTGHPVLVHEVAYPFWMTLGLAVALVDPHTHAIRSTSESTAAQPLGPHRVPAMAMALALLVILGTVPFRSQPLPQDTVTYGVYGWEADGSGAHVRWTGEYASVIVPGDVTTVELPLRAPRPTGIDLGVDGGQFMRAILDDRWQTVTVTLPQKTFDTPYRRVDLHVDRTSTIGTREVGIQLGDVAVSNGQ